VASIVFENLLLNAMAIQIFLNVWALIVFQRGGYGVAPVTEEAPDLSGRVAVVDIEFGFLSARVACAIVVFEKLLKLLFGHPVECFGLVPPQANATYPSGGPSFSDQFAPLPGVPVWAPQPGIVGLLSRHLDVLVGH
jgi:hypothetical protein